MVSRVRGLGLPGIPFAIWAVLGACQEVLHIQEKLLQHLEKANAEEPLEAQARTSPATVAGRTSRFRPAPTAPCSFVQGMVSLLSHAAESNFHTVLDTFTMFASRLSKGRNGRISRRKKMELDSRRAQATCSALILTHGSLALRASKKQLLARLEGDIVGNILLLYSCSCWDLQNTLALVQSIADFSFAFQALGDCLFSPLLEGQAAGDPDGSSWAAGEVHQLCSCCILHCLCGKCVSDGAGVWQLCQPVGLVEELSLCPLPTLTVSLWDLQDLLKKYSLGTPVSPVPLKVVLALEQLSKLKPSLGSEDMCDTLLLCCKNVVKHPSAEMMLKLRKSQQAAQYLQLLQTSLKALGRLMVVLLETETSGGFFLNIVHVSTCGERKDARSETGALSHVLQRSMTSGNMWERKRVLQTCSQLLAACEERGAGEARESWGCLQLLSRLSSLQRGDACKHFGSLVGFLVPLLCDPMPTSRQLAATCLSSLLQLQAKASNRVNQAGDIGSLCEGLNDCSTVCQLQTASKIVRVSRPKRG
ncbi:hypothetical protein CIB84_004800, partial [Bambusicola thoracicus]